MPRSWLITGATGGFGRAIAEAVLARGDVAVLAARAPGELAALVARYPQCAVAVTLDFADPAGLRAIVAQSQTRFGGLDVLVNNAGYGLVGAIEETEPDEYRPLFEANLFGMIELTRAALPVLRRSAKPRIVNLSSVGGIVATAGFGSYNASKFAVEGFSEALALEVGAMGIAVIIVEPGAFRTQVLTGLAEARMRMPDYEATVGPSRAYKASADARQAGDPKRGAQAILQAIDAERPPLRLPLGPDAFRRIREKLANQCGELDAWEAVGGTTTFPKSSPPPKWPMC